MEVDEHEEEIGPIFEEGNTGRPKLGPVGDPARKSGGGGACRYRECQKNHAVGIAGHAVDGCGEFIAAGDDGTLDALKCAACDCHRNFHRKEVEGEIRRPPQLLSYHHRPAAGYPHLSPPPLQQHRPLALPSTVRRDDDNFSNPSSSGGGGGGIGSSKKRHRTKFTAEQKEMMLSLAERLGWRLQKQDEAAVEQFCNETGLKRHVLKVWMHNNKHTLGKKP